jgi:hypothetical protein
LPETTTPDAMGLVSALKEDTRVNSKPFETLPENAVVRQNTSVGTKINKHLPTSRRRIVGVYGFSVLLTLVLFYLHVMVIFDLIGEMLHYKAWLLENVGPKETGKLLLLGCFFALMSAHVAEAAVWGLFLRWIQLLPSITEGIYFTAASITTLGYGDILLKYPWRHLGTLIAITGVLMFGCSTAFLFVTLQDVWQHL